MDGTEEALAGGAVAHLLARSWAADDHARLESAEVVRLGGRAGLSITWSQGDDVQGWRRFGLLMTVEELQHRSRGVPGPAGFTYPYKSWLADLELAVVEPHPGDEAGSARTWFRTIP